MNEQQNQNYTGFHLIVYFYGRVFFVFYTELNWILGIFFWFLRCNRLIKHIFLNRTFFWIFKTKLNKNLIMCIHSNYRTEIDIFSFSYFFYFLSQKSIFYWIHFLFCFDSIQIDFKMFFWEIHCLRYIKQIFLNRTFFKILKQN